MRNCGGIVLRAEKAVVEKDKGQIIPYEQKEKMEVLPDPEEDKPGGALPCPLAVMGHLCVGPVVE